MKNFLVIITAISILNSCKDNGTQPPQTKSVRDYTWTADTLYYEGSIQTLMRSIWGSSSNDIYVCGHSDANRGQIWHYDGVKWSSVNVFLTITSTAYTPYKVHGITSNNVFIVGAKIDYNPNPPPNFLNESFIIQYDGTKWIEHKVNTKSAVNSVYVTSPTEVWACGDDGIVYYYNGNTWDLDTIKINIPQNSEYKLYSIVNTNSSIYILGVLHENAGARSTVYLFNNNNGSWVKADSFVIDSQNNDWKWGTHHLKYTSYNKLLAVGYGIFERNGNEWITILPNYFASFRGSAEKGRNNIIAVGDGGVVYHYDGNNWQLIEKLKDENILYTDVLMYEDEAFIIGNTLDNYPTKTIVLHGK